MQKSEIITKICEIENDPNGNNARLTNNSVMKLKLPDI